MKLYTSENGLCPIVFLQQRGVWGAGTIAGFERKDAERMCSGDRPIARPYFPPGHAPKEAPPAVDTEPQEEAKEAVARDTEQQSVPPSRPVARKRGILGSQRGR